MHLYNWRWVAVEGTKELAQWQLSACKASAQGTQWAQKLYTELLIAGLETSVWWNEEPHVAQESP